MFVATAPSRSPIPLALGNSRAGSQSLRTPVPDRRQLLPCSTREPLGTLDLPRLQRTDEVCDEPAPAPPLAFAPPARPPDSGFQPRPTLAFPPRFPKRYLLAR